VKSDPILRPSIKPELPIHGQQRIAITVNLPEKVGRIDAIGNYLEYRTLR
jgi:hypothetical protein